MEINVPCTQGIFQSISRVGIRRHMEMKSGLEVKIEFEHEHHVVTRPSITFIGYCLAC